MKTKHLNIEMGFAPSCPLITLNATFAMMRGTYIQTHFQNLIYPSDQSSPGTLDPPLPTHERYQNSNANFGFRGSFQMRQNGCHPHRPASAIGIARRGFITVPLTVPLTLPLSLSNDFIFRLLSVPLTVPLTVPFSGIDHGDCFQMGKTFAILITIHRH